MSGPSAGESGVIGTTGPDGSASGMPQPCTSTAAGQAPQQAAPAVASGREGRATKEVALQAAAPAQQQQQQSASPRGREGRASQEVVAAPAQPLQQQQLPAPRGREGRVTQETAVQTPASAQTLQQQQLPTPRRTADVGSAAPRRTSDVRPSFSALAVAPACLTWHRGLL